MQEVLNAIPRWTGINDETLGAFDLAANLAAVSGTGQPQQRPGGFDNSPVGGDSSAALHALRRPARGEPNAEASAAATLPVSNSKG